MTRQAAAHVWFAIGRDAERVEPMRRDGRTHAAAVSAAVNTASDRVITLEPVAVHVRWQVYTAVRPHVRPVPASWVQEASSP